ncbi:RDD family protein [Oryzobacter telluris]|uniref:RDD family protein n=1 Tax=Oryzobacter telluris TaxID=3149179 RepID=UPI00370D41D7
MPADTPPAVAPDGPETASFLRRLGAVVVDWLICQGIALLFTGTQSGGGGAAAFLPLGIFAAMNILFVSVVGSTVGHRLFGMQVWQVRPGTFPLQVIVRTVLLCLFIPAVLTARDGRGYHDVLAGTRIVRP